MAEKYDAAKIVAMIRARAADGEFVATAEEAAKIVQDFADLARVAGEMAQLEKDSALAEKIFARPLL